MLTVPTWYIPLCSDSKKTQWSQYHQESENNDAIAFQRYFNMYDQDQNVVEVQLLALLIARQSDFEDPVLPKQAYGILIGKIVVAQDQSVYYYVVLLPEREVTKTVTLIPFNYNDNKLIGRIKKLTRKSSGNAWIDCTVAIGNVGYFQGLRYLCEKTLFLSFQDNNKTELLERHHWWNQTLGLTEATIVDANSLQFQRVTKMHSVYKRTSLLVENSEIPFIIHAESSNISSIHNTKSLASGGRFQLLDCTATKTIPCLSNYNLRLLSEYQISKLDPKIYAVKLSHESLSNAISDFVDVVKATRSSLIDDIIGAVGSKFYEGVGFAMSQPVPTPKEKTELYATTVDWDQLSWTGKITLNESIERLEQPVFLKRMYNFLLKVGFAAIESIA